MNILSHTMLIPIYRSFYLTLEVPDIESAIKVEYSTVASTIFGGRHIYIYNGDESEPPLV